MFAKQSSPIINSPDGSNVGARYMNKTALCTRRSAADGVRFVATTRGQEVHLIRGSEWQTGARLCPTGVPTALHQGFEPDRRNGDEDEAGARLSTKSAIQRYDR